MQKRRQISKSEQKSAGSLEGSLEEGGMRFPAGEGRRGARESPDLITKDISLTSAGFATGSLTSRGTNKPYEPFLLKIAASRFRADGKKFDADVSFHSET